jgi:hypothetical protein
MSDLRKLLPALLILLALTCSLALAYQRTVIIEDFTNWG